MHAVVYLEQYAHCTSNRKKAMIYYFDPDYRCFASSLRIVRVFSFLRFDINRYQFPILLFAVDGTSLLSSRIFNVHLRFVIFGTQEQAFKCVTQGDLRRRFRSRPNLFIVRFDKLVTRAKSICENNFPYKGINCFVGVKQARTVSQRGSLCGKVMARK